MVMVTVMFMVRPWDGASDVRRSHRNALGCLEEIVALRDLSLGRGGAVKEYAATRISLLAELDAYISSYRRTIQTCLHVDIIWVVSPWIQDQGQIDRSTMLPWRSPSLFGAFFCNADC